MLPFNRLFLKTKNVCTGFEIFLKEREKTVKRRLFDDITLEYFFASLCLSVLGICINSFRTDRQ